MIDKDQTVKHEWERMHPDWSGEETLDLNINQVKPSV